MLSDDREELISLKYSSWKFNTAMWCITLFAISFCVARAVVDGIAAANRAAVIEAEAKCKCEIDYD